MSRRQGKSFLGDNPTWKCGNNICKISWMFIEGLSLWFLGWTRLLRLKGWSSLPLWTYANARETHTCTVLFAVFSKKFLDAPAVFILLAFVFAYCPGRTDQHAGSLEGRDATKKSRRTGAVLLTFWWTKMEQHERIWHRFEHVCLCVLCLFHSRLSHIVLIFNIGRREQSTRRFKAFSACWRS